MKEKFSPLCNEQVAYQDGTCCCNCIHQKKLMSHPWNYGFGSGQMSEQCGWVCTVFMNMKSEPEECRLIYFSFMHGCCELHSPTKECQDYIIAQSRAEKIGFWE